MNTHYIKLNKEFCDAVLSGEKNFEVRFNDRGYQKGDTVSFLPYDGIKPISHPVSMKTYNITYVLSGWGIVEGWIVFGIEEVSE